MKTTVCFHASAWEDYLYWQKTDKKILRKINDLIQDIQKHPFKGLGKPEALRFELKGYWSRRIDDRHRLVYKIKEGQVIILQCRYHY